MRILSFKWLLLISINGLMLIIFATTGTMAYLSALDELDEVYDAQLAHTARMLITLQKNTLIEKTNQPIVVPVPQLIDHGESLSAKEQRQYSVHKYENKIAFQLWSGTQLLMRSENTKDFQLSKQSPGYHEIRHEGTLWITYSLFDPINGLWAYTAQREDVREELSENLAEAEIRPLMFSFLPISIGIYFLISYLLRPINNLSDELIKRGQKNLSKVEIKLPKELVPILTAINNLLYRVESYLLKEKRFIADASHELRTPLAIMKVHAENLESAEPRPDQLAAIQAINSGSKNMSHLVDQLLALAKLESANEVHFQKCSLRALIEESLSQLAIDQLESKQWSINVSGDVEADPALMQIALRNILENAAKYSPDDDAIDVVSLNQPEQCEIVIENSVNYEPELSRVEERFYRHRESQDIPGSGLGLSIVKHIVELHTGKVQYKNVNGRFQVHITLKKIQ